MPTQAPKETYGAQADAPANPAPDDATRLHQMRDRLASLSDEARTMRSQVPREFEPDVERIQQQMQRLGERLSELSGGAVCPAMPAAARDAAQAPGCEPGEAPRAAPDEVILLGGPCQSDNPWDEESATALARFYETGEGYAGSPGARTQGEAPQASAAAAGYPMLPASWLKGSDPTNPPRSQGMLAVEPAWLDQRFADIARRIEQSLAEMRPESSLLSIGNRFDQLEARMGSALRGVATRADIEQLRVAEAQIEEIGSQLDQLRRSLSRLDAIDAQLGTLAQQLTSSADPTRLSAIDAQLAAIAEQLSNERLADIFSQSVGRGLDIESLAAATAQKTAARLADPALRETHSRDIGEVRGMLESLINERRHSDENNASMLDTMQQAIIRVLDRIDALELAQQHAAGPAPASEPAQAPPAAAASARADADRAAGQSQPAAAQPSYYEAPFFTPAREESPTAPAPQSPFAAAPFDLDAAFASDRDADTDETPANAPPQRAIDALRHDFIADAHRAKLKAASKRDAAGDPPPARGEFWANLERSASAPPKPRRSIFRSPRVLMTILVLLGMIPAAVFFMPRMPANDDAFPAAETMVPPEGTPGTGIGAATESAPATPASNGAQAPAAPMDPLPSKPSQQTLAPDPQPRTERYEDVGAPTPIGMPGRIDTASIPDTIMTGAGAGPAAQQLAQSHSDSRMAFVSDTPPAPATTAALMQDTAVRMNGIAAAAPDADSAKPLALPPALVGPYSLRLAAAQGDPSAQYEVAVRLAQGKGDTDQDLKEAAQWYQRAATSGFAMAQFRLGTLYERGVGVPTDSARAQVWYARAAEQGNVKAMHNLAVLIAAGGGKPDYATAARWFTAAAERGLSDSQYNLAMLYESGLGVTKDAKTAYKWLLLAAKSNDAEAKSRRDAVAATLTPEVRAAIEDATKAWRARPVDPVANDSRLAGQAWKRASRNG